MWTRILISLLFTTFTAYIGLGIIQPILPKFATSLKATGLMLGLIFSAISIPRIVLNPVIGKLSDKADRKIYIVTGLAIYSFVAIGYTYVTTPVGLLIVRLFAGVAFALVMPVVSAYIGSLAPDNQEAKYMATLNMACGFGIAAGPIIGGVISDKYDIYLIFYVQAIFLFSAFLISMVFLPKTEHFHIKPSISKRPMVKILKSNLMRGLLLSTIINSIALSGIVLFMPLLCDQRGLGYSEIGILLSTVIIISGALQIPFGKLADRHDKINLIIIGSIFGVVGLLILPSAQTFISFIYSSIIIAFGMAISGPAGSGLIIQHSKSINIGLGVSIGILGSFQEAGLIVGPIISGLIMDTFDIYTVFYTTAVLQCIAIAVLYFFAKIRKS